MSPEPPVAASTRRHSDKGKSALRGESDLRHLPAFILLADEVFDRDFDLIQEYLGKFLVARDLLDRAYVNPFGLHVHQQESDACLLRPRTVGANQQETLVGEVAERGPDLLARDNVAIPLALRPRAQRRQV